MDLVIKPTEQCNFNCTFCSSPQKDKFEILDVNKVLYFLDCYPDTRTIIVNGGDPLMMDPSYYYKILDHIKIKKRKTTLCLMTNLYDYWLYPDKWSDLFSINNVRVGTSFQYGEGRRIGTKVFTEEFFIKIMNKFTNNFGYTPMFIAVIDEDNEYSIINTIKLAKQLNTTCKINGMFKSGRAIKPYPLYKMYKHYLYLINIGLDKYELNSKNLKNFSQGLSTCNMPYNRKSCEIGIRCMGTRDEYHACPAINDDHYKDYQQLKPTFQINFEADMKKQNTKSLTNIHLICMKHQCLLCSLFKLCNNCAKHVKDHKEMGDKFIEEHCVGMKKQQKALEKYL